MPSIRDTIMALTIGQKFVLVLLVLGNFITISLQASTKKSDSYVAAVVEYAPVSGVTLENKDEVFMQNVAVYGCLMEQAAKQGVDIIVFPEVGLASFGVPLNEDDTPSLAFYVPEPGANPCNDNSSEIAQGLRELSCAAGKHQLYAVVNLPERVNCSGCPCPGFPVTVDGLECPPAGAYFHNTNVVFDRNGTIVARYRKFNLFGEPGFVPTQQPEFATFETDFGVTFGTFICFDIMFEKPAVELMKEHFVCDFAFPTAWFSEVPFLTAVQTQAAWAYAMDVNLLAAGYDMPEVGSAGSGIFAGRGGALQASMPNATTSRLLVASVPKIRRCKEAARARRRRAAPPPEAMPPEVDDDDDSAEERTPLSAFHHIVRMRKLGHIGSDDEAEPSWEYEPKVPPHFMGLHQTEQDEDDQQAEQALQGYIEYEDEAPEDSLHSRPQEGIPQKKIPASTDTERHVIGLPSQNPDLPKLYQLEEVEKLPEDFLEIEVPEEQPFEPEHEHEYFEQPPVEERQGGSDETEGKDSLPTGDGAAAAGDSDDLSAPPLQEERESEATSIGTELWEESDDISTRMYEEQRNVTEQEIEDTRKQFEWLTDDRDTPEKERDMSSAPSTGNGEATLDPVDETDDILPENEPDTTAATDASPKPETESGGELTGGSKSDTLVDDKQPSKLLRKLKKSSSDREHWRSRMERLKRKSAECKCRRRHKGEKSSPEVHGTITDDKLDTESPTEKKQPEEQQEPFNDLDREGAGEDTQNDEQSRNGGDFDLEAVTGDTQPEEEQAPSVEVDREAVAEDIEPEEQPPGGDDQDLEAITEDTQPEKETTAGDEYEVQAIVEATQSDAEQQEKGYLEEGKPSRPCRLRERPESLCPPISNGVLDDERVNKSTVGLFLKRDHLEVYKTFTLNTESLIENSTVILCHGTFCCNFHVVLEVNAELDQPRYAYRLAVFDGVRTFDGVATGGVQVCAVIPCSHEDMDSCGMLTLPDDAAYATVFRTINITGVFSTNHTLVTASTVGPGLQALPVDKFNLTSAPLGEAEARVSLHTTAAVQQEGLSLLTFGIYSRVFNRDGQPVSAPP